MYKILVCGGRDYIGYRRMYEVLTDIIDQIILDYTIHAYNDVEIIQGGATGADFLAKVFALDEFDGQVHHKEFPAEWKKYGKAAGGIRNQQMLDEGKPNLVVAFPGGKGTADMVKRAKKAGIKVVEID